MRRIILISIAALVFLIFSPQAFGGTAIVINSATVDGTDLQLTGTNFTAFDSLGIWIGDVCLTCFNPSKCSVGDILIECDFAGTPAESGGTWTVSVSAGNAPHMNEEIDVFIPVGLAPACNAGDFIECYTGDPATNGVGLCQSGIRTCVSGIWSACEGQVLPQTEDCDGLDNDCNGVVDDVAGAGTLCTTGLFGVCNEGVTACVAGTLECVPNIVPGEQVEVCDGLDNDCDALIDEDFDLSSDEDNCGSCSNACSASDDCCEGLCVDLNNDEENCGVCGNSCPANVPGETCSGSGSCECLPGSGTSCEGNVNSPDCCPTYGCVDLQTDAVNCGACGHMCEPIQTCQNGVCS